MPKNSLTIERAAIDSLVPYEKNPRIGNLDAISESLAQHGQYRPLVIRAETREILGGNHTWKAAKSLGWSEVDVTLIDVDAEQAKRIVLVDNATSDRADYDNRQLLELLDSLDGLDGTGYGEDDLRAVLAEIDDEPGGGKTDPDDVPDPPAKPKTKTGDLWVLGDHRLICGDSTHPDVLERLMGGATIEAVWTDPPYNIDYKGGVRTIENDNLELDEFGQLLERALENSNAHAVEGAPIYVTHGETTRHQFQVALEAAGWLYKQTLIWVKSSFTLSRQDYQWQHEPIMYGWKPGSAHRWYGEFDKSTVLDDGPAVNGLDVAQLKALVKELRNERNTSVIHEDKPSRSGLHPTMKPVGLIVHCLQNSTQRQDCILDPFGGSGSTLIAAEQLGRKAFLVELDPSFCDVIVRRWEDFTGREATRGKAVEAYA